MGNLRQLTSPAPSPQVHRGWLARGLLTLAVLAVSAIALLSIHPVVATAAPATVTVSFDGTGGTLNKTSMTSKAGYPLGNSSTNLLTTAEALPTGSAGSSNLTCAWATDSGVASGKAVKQSRTTAGTADGGWYYPGTGFSPALTVGSTYTWTLPVKGKGNCRIGVENIGLMRFDLTSARYVPCSYTGKATSSSYKAFVVYLNSLPASDYIMSGLPVVQAGGLTPLPTATREGYRFKGWFTAACGGTQVDDANHTTIVTPASNTTYYAQWEPVSVTVSFDGNGGTLDKTSMTSKTGYPVGNPNPNVFSCWNALPDVALFGKCTKAWQSDSSMPSGRAIKVQRTATSNSQDGYYYNYGGACYDGQARLPSGSQYTFTTSLRGTGRWCVGQEQGGYATYTLDSSRNVPASMTYNAAASGNKSVVFYEQDDAVGTVGYFGVPVVQAGGLDPLPVAARAGYRFVGWFTSPTGGTQVDDAAHTTIITPRSATTYYAHWESLPVTVSFDGNGGVLDKTQMTSRTGCSLGLSTANLMEGNLFGSLNGAATSDEIAFEVVPDASLASGVAFHQTRIAAGSRSTGHYTNPSVPLTVGETYTLTFRARGTGAWRVGHHQGGELLLDFSGYCDGESVPGISSEEVQYPIPVVEDSVLPEYRIHTKTFTAMTSWEHAVMYGYSSDIVGSELYAGDFAIQQGTPTPLPIATRPGYAFLGWFTSPTGGTQVDDDGHTTIVTPNGDTTYYAHWMPIEMTGAGDPNNPDIDGDGYGDNITFSVPSSVTFAILPDGTFVAPTNAAIENLGDFGIHVSSARVLPASPYSLASEISAATPPNTICLLYGAGGTAGLLATGYSEKTALPAEPSWGIQPASSLAISFAGRTSRLTQDAPQTPAKFATMEWWVAPGLIPNG